VVLLGGCGPMDVSKRRPWIDWVHTASVQGQLVRDFVKWDDQPYGSMSVMGAWSAGFRLCKAKPQGPVYIALDADGRSRRWIRLWRSLPLLDQLQQLSRP